MIFDENRYYLISSNYNSDSWFGTRGSWLGARGSGLVNSEQWKVKGEKQKTDDRLSEERLTSSPFFLLTYSPTHRFTPCAFAP